MIGTKLAHYEITSYLGSGGMGEIYCATDLKLGRSVAIKLLPAAFASDADRTGPLSAAANAIMFGNHRAFPGGCGCFLVVFCSGSI
jgi:serine/threonine protein kinase